MLINNIEKEIHKKKTKRLKNFSDLIKREMRSKISNWIWQNQWSVFLILNKKKLKKNHKN